MARKVLPMVVPPSSTPDFAALDFERLWRGREKTTRVESAAVIDLLGPSPLPRVLEIGSGGGRLTGTVKGRATELVALDVTREFLERVRGPSTSPPGGVRVAANVYRLPFVDRSLSAAVMVRVFNFLADPAAALSEVVRVLRPGGRLVLSYEPRPSPGTLAGDLRSSLRPHDAPVASQTFTRAEVVRVHPSSFPAWAPTRHRMRQILEAAGLEIRAELGTGLEDFRPFRAVPDRLLLRLGVTFGRGADGLFPSRFVAAAVPGDPAEVYPLPALDSMFACPQCAGFLGRIDLTGARRWPCVRCGFILEYGVGRLDAIAPGTGARPGPSRFG